MALLEGEFLEGIRAALIDRSPRWRYPSHDSVPQALIQRLLQSARDGAPDLSGALSQTEST